MKVVVELDEFWMDGDDELSLALNNFVKKEVMHDVWRSIEEKVEKTITSHITEVMTTQLKKKVNEIIVDLIENEKVKAPNYYKNPDDNGRCTLKQSLMHKFQKDTGWGDPLPVLEKLAKNYGAEMKNRYDLMFASQVVIKMGEQGLLKPGVVESLLNKDNS